MGRVKVINLDDLEKLQITFLTASSSVETESVGEIGLHRKKFPVSSSSSRRRRGLRVPSIQSYLPQSTCTLCITQ